MPDLSTYHWYIKWELDKSTLLRSNDGGTTWAEVMKPVRGSRVIDFQMLKTGDGWALVMWEFGDYGPILLFHTTDFGQNWTELTKISIPNAYLPSDMVFFDSQHGQLIMSDTGVYGTEVNVSFLTTTDGGVNWNVSGQYFPPFENPGMRASAAGAILSTTIKDFSESVSIADSYVDQSYWKVEITFDSIIISRRLYTENSYQIRSILPTKFLYQANLKQITMPGK